MMKLTSATAQQLKLLACNQIHARAQQAAKSFGNTSSGQREAMCVAYLCGAMPAVCRAWQGVLPVGVGLSIATVFTHQSPCVTWPKKRCELADLLLAIINRNAATGVAMLVQAKLSSNGSVALATLSEQKQFELYSTRPVFDVDKNPAPKTVNLKSLVPDCGLTYGMTGGAGQISPPPNTSWPQCWPHNWLVADGLTARAGTYSAAGSPCLANDFVELLRWGYGWKFALPPIGQDWQHFTKLPHRDDWSALINYLLEQTFRLPLRPAKAVAAGHKDRGTEDVICLRSTNGSGQPVFCAFNQLPETLMARYLNGGEPEAQAGWQATSLEQLLGNGGFGSGQQDTADTGDNDGPISAVVLEVSDEAPTSMTAAPGGST